MGVGDDKSRVDLAKKVNRDLNASRDKIHGMDAHNRPC